MSHQKTKTKVIRADRQAAGGLESMTKSAAATLKEPSTNCKTDSSPVARVKGQSGLIMVMISVVNSRLRATPRQRSRTPEQRSNTLGAWKQYASNRKCGGTY